MSGNTRVLKLEQLYNSILRGVREVSPQNGILFLESIIAQKDAPGCISNLIASSAGLSAVQAAMRFNLSTPFLNGAAAGLLRYLATPSLKNIHNGQFLRDMIIKIVDPPIFWNAFLQGFVDGELDVNAQHYFAWLLRELISLPGETGAQYRKEAQSDQVVDILLISPQFEIRNFGQKIKHVLDTYAICPTSKPGDGPVPGGRHDNDFADFRKISILPTADELGSIEPAFLLPSVALDDPVTEDKRTALHLDNQFRLLREDMLYEIREEWLILSGKKKGHHRGIIIEGLKLFSVYCGKEDRRCKWGIALQCKQDLPQLKGEKDRKQYLIDHRNFVKHQSMGCLIADGEILAFSTIFRDEELLSKKPPIIILQLEGEERSRKVFHRLKKDGDIKLIQIDTAVFSYEPVLRALQEKEVLPLSSELLLWKKDSIVSEVSKQASPIVNVLRQDPTIDIGAVLGTNKNVKLDKSQANSLLIGLTQKVALIQGPPGTGKSFIGELIAKALHDFTDQNLLVVCYTNHALDDILTGLLDIGISASSMVRLGGKSTPRTEPLTLQNQTSDFRLRKSDWSIIQELKAKSERLCGQLQASFDKYMSFNVQPQMLLDHLEFEDPEFFEAFQVPMSTDDMTRVGSKGRSVAPHYLLDQWMFGRDPGIFRNHPHIQEMQRIWEMSRQVRQTHIQTWKESILEDTIAITISTAQKFNACQDQLAHMLSERQSSILRSKRIIGCTTTAAAKYNEDIRLASPDILLVEEAGEILESHVLTALGHDTKQIILIGDHKQLRPKVNNYALTVEKGEGYDLNRSLFERLILKDYPHESLTEQHRMRPEISSLIRNLTYPELVDGAGTNNRESLRGVQNNIVFVNHSHPEDEDQRLTDRRDGTPTSSKRNTFEVNMVLQIVRYLAQQGYGTNKLVILTPYLGQLLKLKEVLSKDNDPVLDDLDSYDLVRAGLIPAATAKLTKRPIRIATIDNYQGEESDIVIVSLTRSNSSCDIGFMFSPERLNVLLSRARDSLIMIGNADTFRNSRKGREIWSKLFDLLGRGKYLYDGFPVQCQRHVDQKAVICQPTKFDEICPDGGCSIPCGTMLSCGIHPCPSKCHQLFDHTRMVCEYLMSSKCIKGHEQRWKCHQPTPTTCPRCDRIAKLEEKRRREEFAAQEKRDEELRIHLQRVADLDAEIAKEVQAKRDARLARERATVIEQKQKDLEATRALSSQTNAAYSSHSLALNYSGHETKETPSMENRPSVERNGDSECPNSPDPSKDPNASVSGAPLSTNLDQPILSPSQQEWKRQKEVDGASNTAVDAIMGMIGLEAVKEQVLGIKVKIDTAIRQDASLSRERFNVALLGNPGTGKTTVARHYATFLAAVDVLPGTEFFETTGSRLSNDGVDAIKKQLEKILNSGGGAIFVDEAYQLTTQHNLQGRQILDFLLAEMENNIGKLVFIFAGYNKEMEKFFEHNPGLQSRVPYKLQFQDYTDHELSRMLDGLIQNKFEGRMKCEAGINGLYGRIAIRRLGRLRGREGFGNARDLETLLDRIHQRQASRLNKERSEGRTPDDFLFCAEDLIGPDPSKVIGQSKSWAKLRSLTGLRAVKQSVQTLFDGVTMNYRRELEEKEPIQVPLNRVFVGSPGTGKTTVAKLYGQILADLSLLSNGEVQLKNPSDFIGSVLGESEANTKGILANAAGKVLIIDEAYMLYTGGGNTGGGQKNDPFKDAVIDTIVAEVQSVLGEDRCVLLLGYRDQMVEMFQNVNPGLSRRFRIEEAFDFEDFNASELLEILNLKLKDQHLEATTAAKTVAIEVLNRARNRPNFGNGGEVENLIGHAKERYMTRLALLPVERRPVDVSFEPQDFDAHFDRDAHASTNLAELFEDVVGHEAVMTKMEEYQKMAHISKARNEDPRELIPTNFIFKGPPGTGKTTIARKMGQIYYDMGILSSKEVVECSASDLVGQFVGQTGPKTKKLFERALGKVLFIDEAYRLSEGHFAQEAVDELVGLLTHKAFKSKVIIILAGYDEDMNRLLDVNTGLSSRFPQQIMFSNIAPKHCLEVIGKELEKNKVRFDKLTDLSSTTYIKMVNLVEKLSDLPGWGNARDMITLAKEMTRQAFLKHDTTKGVVILAQEDAIVCMNNMLMDRQARNKVPMQSRRLSSNLPEQTFTPAPRSLPATRVKRAPPSKTASPKTAAQPIIQEGGFQLSVHSHPNQRDAGVSDEVWSKLQAAKQAGEEAEREAAEVIKKLQREVVEEEKRLKAQELAAKALAREQARARDQAEQDELRRKLEEARLKELAARAAKEQVAALLKARQQEEQRKRKQEAEAQRKLREMGVCPVGYRWIKTGNMYRCAGGSHTVSLHELGM